MSIEIFEINTKENKVYRELLERYKTDLELQNLLNKNIFPAKNILAGDFRLINMIEKAVETDNIKVCLVKDTDNDTFLWAYVFFEDKSKISMYPLLKKQSRKLQVEVRKTLIEKGFFNELSEKKYVFLCLKEEARKKVTVRAFSVNDARFKLRVSGYKFVAYLGEVQ